MKWLNGLVTCDVSKLAVGQSSWSLLVARKGKIISDLVVAVPADGLVILDVDAAAAVAVHEHLEHHLIMEDVELSLRDDAPRVALGPGAVALPRGLVAVDDGASMDFDGPPGDDPELFEELRFAHGWPAFRVDYDDAFYPQEAALEGIAVAFDKGCYLGQEVVFMLQVRGKVKRRLALLDTGAPAGTAVTRDGKSVGAITSTRGARSFALLTDAAWEPGTTLDVVGAAARVLS